MNINSSVPGMAAGRNGLDKKARPVRHHIKVSIEDLNWVRSQKSCVQQLWLDCCAAEQFGKQLRKLEANLSDKSFRIARSTLEQQGLFKFEPVCKVTQSGRSAIIGWKVENLHGYYIKAYWEDLPDKREDLPTEKEDLPNEREKISLESEEILFKAEILPDVEPEYTNSKGFETFQLSPNYSSTPYQQPTKVVGRVVNNMIPHEKQPPAPGGASAIVQQDGKEERLNAAVLEEDSVNPLDGNTDQPETLGTTLDYRQDTFSAAAAVPLEKRRKLGRGSLAPLSSVELQVDQQALDSGRDDSSVCALPQKTALLVDGDSDRAILVQTICQQISTVHCYWVTQAQREVMVLLTPNQLQRVVKTFQQLMSKRSAHTKTMRFDHALRIGRHSAS